MLLLIRVINLLYAFIKSFAFFYSFPSSRRTTTIIIIILYVDCFGFTAAYPLAILSLIYMPYYSR